MQRRTIQRTGLLPIIAAIAVGFAYKCSLSSNELPTLECPPASADIADWESIGPFYISDSGHSAIDANLLDPHLDDAAIDASHYVAVARALANRGPGTARSTRITGSCDIDFHYAFGIKEPLLTGQEVFYAACRVHSATGGIIHALVKNDDQIEIFLNGAIVYTSRNVGAMSGFSGGFDLPLKQGQNFLLAKIVNVAGDTGFGLRLTPSLDTATLAALESNRVFLQNLLTQPHDRLVISIPAAPAPGDIGIAVETAAGKMLIPPQPYKLSSAPAAFGLYKAEIEVAGRQFRETFCVGDPSAVWGQLSLRFARRPTSERAKIDFGVLHQRLDVLTRAQNRKPNDFEWQRKVVYTLAEAEDIVTAIEDRHDPLRGIPGLHLRGFRSRIDDQVASYRLYIPKCYSSDTSALPLVVIMPTVMSADRPFIESTFVAHQLEAEAIGRLAEKYHVGILWSGYRRQPYGNPCDFAHFEEVIADVSRDYHLDLTRIYLAGECTGGMFALAHEVHWPRRFAGIGVIDSYFHRDRYRFDYRDTFNSAPAYKIFLQSTDPASNFLRQPDAPPLLIINHGAAPGHGELGVSLDFLHEANKLNRRPRFEFVPRYDGSFATPWERLLAWFVQQHRQDPDVSPANEFASIGAVGPIARVLAQRVLVVEGTGGGESDQNAARLISHRFRDDWETTTRLPCRFQTDSTVTDEDTADSNLVLIGNAQTNAVWRKFADKLDISLQPGRIRINNREWTGNELSIQAVFHNPANPDRYVVLIGAAELPTAKFVTLDLGLDGWYDYLITECRQATPSILSAGYYSN